MSADTRTMHDRLENAIAMLEDALDDVATLMVREHPGPNDDPTAIDATARLVSANNSLRLSMGELREIAGASGEREGA